MKKLKKLTHQDRKKGNNILCGIFRNPKVLTTDTAVTTEGGRQLPSCPPILKIKLWQAAF